MFTGNEIVCLLGEQLVGQDVGQGHQIKHIWWLMVR